MSRQMVFIRGSSEGRGAKIVYDLILGTLPRDALYINGLFFTSENAFRIDFYSVSESIKNKIFKNAKTCKISLVFYLPK